MGWLTTPESSNIVPAFKFRRPDAGGTFGGATLPALLWPDFPIPTLPIKRQLAPPLQVTGFGVGAIAATPTFPQPGLEAVPLKSRLFRNVGMEVAETWPILQFQVTGWRQPEETVPLRSRVWPRPPEGFGGPGIIPYLLWVPTIADMVALRSRLTRLPTDLGPEQFPPGTVVVVAPLSAWPPSDVVALRKTLLKPLQVTGFGVGAIIPTPAWLPVVDDILPIRSRLFRPLKGAHEEPEAWSQVTLPFPGWLRPDEIIVVRSKIIKPSPVAGFGVGAIVPVVGQWIQSEVYGVPLKALFRSGQTVFSGGGAFFQIPSWWIEHAVPLPRLKRTIIELGPEPFSVPPTVPAPISVWPQSDVIALRKQLIIPLQVTGFGIGQITPSALWLPITDDLIPLRGKLLRGFVDVTGQLPILFQIPSWMEPNEPVVLRSRLYRPARDAEPEAYPILVVGPFPSDEFLLLKIGGKLYLTLAGNIKMQTP